VTTRELIRLRYGRGVVLEPFLNRVYGASNVRHLVCVSPWMTHLSFLTGDTRKLIYKLGSHRTHVTIITRKPESEEHTIFISDATVMEFCEVFFVPDLHAKYYVCHTNDRSFAVVGSPNLYRWTAQSFEVGVIIESKGEGETIIVELDNVTYHLKTAFNCEVYKRLGTKKGG